MSQSRLARAQALPPEDWFNVLEELLNRDWELDRLAPARYAQDPDQQKAPVAKIEAHAYRLDKLLALFRKYECYDYVRLMVGSGSAPPLPYDPPAEVETAALRAVLDWLSPAPIYPRYASAEEQEELRELRRAVGRAAKARLRQLEGDEGSPVPAVPWEGDDWDSLEPQVRQLLIHMHGRNRADLRELCPLVWGKEYLTDNGVTEKARETTTSKANRFLNKRQWPRLLAKVPKEPYLRWE